MMYSEFVEGTGCKDTEFNYGVFKNLEAMYMNTNMTKAEVYEYGKKLVDNSKTEEEIRFEKQIKAEIEEHEAEIERYKKYVDDDKELLGFWEAWGENKDQIAFYKNNIKHWKQEIVFHRRKITELKWVLG